MILLNFLFVMIAGAQTHFDNDATTVNNRGGLPQVLIIEKAVAGTSQVHAGARFPVELSVRLLEGHSAYEDKLKIRTLAPDNMTVSEIEINPLIEFDDFSKKRKRGFQNQTTLRFFVELPATIDASLKELVFDLEYVACTAKVCLPQLKQIVNVPITISTTPTARKSSFEAQVNASLVWTFILVFFFGFLASLTPCVYPLIPITLAVIGSRAAQSNKSQAFLLSFVYVLGIAATYSVLGVITAKTGALFGQALSYPPVVIGFAILFTVMAASMYGYFEIQVPDAVTRRISGGGGSKGFIGAFVAGLIAGVVASPCVGPVLVGVLAYIAKTQNTILGFSLLFTFAMGMGILFMVLGTFSSLLKKIPRSGSWLELIKVVLGTAMLGVALYYLQPVVSAILFQTLCVAAAFIALSELAKKSSQPSVNRWLAHCLLGIAVVASAAYYVTQKPAPGAENSKLVLKNGWSLYSDKALADAQAAGRPVIIDFFADWCAACVELDEKTFSRPDFISRSKDFVLLKVDATESFEGLSELQQKYEVYGLPTIVFIDKNGKMISDLSLTGFEEVNAFLRRMDDALKR